MSESMMDCSSCGKPFPTRFQELDDNGNPICPDCAREERESKNRKEEQ